MSGPQWREHAVISQVVAHVPPLGQQVVETVSRPYSMSWKNCLQSDSRRSHSVGISVVCHVGQAYSVSGLTTAANTLSML